MKILTAKDLVSLNPESLSDGVLELECNNSGIARDEAVGKMREYVKVWREAAQRMGESEERTFSKMVGGDAKKIRHAKAFLGGELLRKAAFYSLSVSQTNALMGRIVAAPTAGSCGVLPGALLAVADEQGFGDEMAAKSIFAASGIGMLIRTHASFAGAAVGCQGEIGSAAAMAAASCVDIMGGSSQQALHAASLSLKNHLGLVCDPIAGLVEVPCVRRNSMAASHAINAASLALCGVESVVPFEEVVAAMNSIGARMSPSLKETSRGGLAVTPTGQAMSKCARRQAGKFDKQ